MTKLQAVFLDRDGVLNRYLPNAYVEKPSQIELIPGAAEAVLKLNMAGVAVIVVSNQQGVGKGVMTLEELNLVEAALRSKLTAESGAMLTRTYYCPHVHEDHCECRKPKPGMLLKAMRDYDLAPSRTALIGDSPGDLQAAGAAGVSRKVLVLSGTTNRYHSGNLAVEPDAVFASIEPAIDWLLEETE